MGGTRHGGVRAGCLRAGPTTTTRLSHHDASSLRSRRSGRHTQTTAAAATPRGRAIQSPSAAAADVEEVATTTTTTWDAESLGFRKVGDPVPAGIPMRDVLSVIPPEAFEIDHAKSWKSLALTLAATALSTCFIAVAPWYLLPVAWAVAGTAFTGYFVLGHDCAHKSFHRNKIVEDVVGTALFAALIYPYEAWRFKHNQHHAKTNMLVEDTAWHPVVLEEMDEMSPFMRKATQALLGSPLKMFASIGHWAKWHFDLGLYKKTEKPRVLTSIASCAAFAAVAWPLLVHYTGWFGLFKFWVMPWLGFHFWLSTFTLVHHTSPHIPFKAKEAWDPVQAQLGGTVHCDYPKWIEVLCFDINVHVPHHLSPRIPHYHLRTAYDAIKANYGQYITEGAFNLNLVKTLVNEPHVYDEKENYKPFSEYKDRY